MNHWEIRFLNLIGNLLVKKIPKKTKEKKKRKGRRIACYTVAVIITE